MMVKPLFIAAASINYARKVHLASSCLHTWAALITLKQLTGHTTNSFISLTATSFSPTNIPDNLSSYQSLENLAGRKGGRGRQIDSGSDNVTSSMCGQDSTHVSTILKMSTASMQFSAQCDNGSCRGTVSNIPSPDYCSLHATGDSSLASRAVTEQEPAEQDTLTLRVAAAGETGRSKTKRRDSNIYDGSMGALESDVEFMRSIANQDFEDDIRTQSLFTHTDVINATAHRNTCDENDNVDEGFCRQFQSVEMCGIHDAWSRLLSKVLHVTRQRELVRRAIVSCKHSQLQAQQVTLGKSQHK